MRTKFLKSMMPAMVIVFAIGAAFATQAKEVNSTVLMDAYLPPLVGESECRDTPIQCDTDVKDNICTYQGEQAFGLADENDLTSCSVDLYRD